PCHDWHRRDDAGVDDLQHRPRTCRTGTGRRERHHLATSFYDGLDTPAANDFVRRFKEYTGENDYIGEYGEGGYRGMALWAEAVRRAVS
ncbi:MAG: hypothetical protein E8G75_04480, partial [Sulfitobacter sp. SK025]